MSEREKTIVAKYVKAVEEEGLSEEAMAELITFLSSTRNASESRKRELFYSTFGAWESDKSAEEIIEELRDAKHFRDKDLSF